MTLRNITKRFIDLTMVVRSVDTRRLFEAMECDCWPKANLGIIRGRSPLIEFMSARRLM